MLRFARTVAGVVALPMLAGGCGPFAIKEKFSLPAGEALVTSAEVRTVMQTRPQTTQFGRVVPSHITCAEPSPDVAKVVSQAVGAGGALSVSGLPSGISPKAAAAISSANAQAVAQLTERLATIQLLRDGLHRACEAYANGAVSDTTYAIMLSRFDKLMVTLLLGEIAGGAFGRPLAALTAEATADAMGKLDSSDERSRSSQPQPAPASTGGGGQAGSTAGTGSPGGAAGTGTGGTGTPGPTGGTGGGTGKGTGSGDGTPGTTPADQLPETMKIADKLDATAKSMAKTAAIAAGEIKTQKDAAVAKTLYDMQRKYVENINFDALEIACVSALDREQLSGIQVQKVIEFAAEYQKYEAATKEAIEKDRWHKPKPPEALGVAAKALQDVSAGARVSALSSYCLSSLIPSTQVSKGQLLAWILQRAEADKDAATTRADLLKTLEETKKYLEAYLALPGGKPKGDGDGKKADDKK